MVLVKLIEFTAKCYRAGGRNIQKDREDIMIAALAALNKIVLGTSAASAGMRRRVASLPAAEAIVQAIWARPTDTYFTGCALLGSIYCQQNCYLGHLVQSSVCDIMSSALAASPTHPGINLDFFRILRSLSIQKDGSQVIIKAKLCEKVVAATKIFRSNFMYSADGSVQLECLQIVTGLAQDDDGRQAMVDAGACEAIVESMKCFSDR